MRFAKVGATHVPIAVPEACLKVRDGEFNTYRDKICFIRPGITSGNFSILKKMNSSLISRGIEV